MIRIFALFAFALGALSIATGTIQGEINASVSQNAEIGDAPAASPELMESELSVEESYPDDKSLKTGSGQDEDAGIIDIEQKAVETGKIIIPGSPIQGSVFLISIDSEIELGLAAYVRRIINNAKSADAGALVIRINTPGGRVDAALDIKDSLLDCRIPTIALIDRQAFSAGALIALAAEHVYMVPGSSIGAAAPVSGDGELAGEKMVSALRTAFASTAERRGRNPLIAKAMVDDSLTIEGIVESGKLLTLTHNEAIKAGIADGTMESLDSLFEALVDRKDRIVKAEPTLIERLVRFLTNPAVAALLMSIGFLGMFFELQSPGWGIGGTIALLCLGTYFWGHHLAGLAGWESAILIGIGILLMVVEVFILPGFGLFGILGLISFVTGLFLSRMSQFGLPGEITKAFYVMSATLLMMLAGAWAMVTYLPKNRFFAGIVLFSSATGEGGPGKSENIGPPWGKNKKSSSYIGFEGEAITDLRPSGTVRINGEPVDVITEGAYIQSGTMVEIVEENGTRRVVRALEKEKDNSSDNS